MARQFDSDGLKLCLYILDAGSTKRTQLEVELGTSLVLNPDNTSRARGIGSAGSAYPKTARKNTYEL